MEDYDADREEIGGYGGNKKPHGEIKFTIVQKIDHPGEVNKARYMPQNANMVATMCVDGRVMIWDRTKHRSQPTGEINPDMELSGHTDEGYGLDWSPHVQGQLATASQDQTVRLWKITDYTKSNKMIHSYRTYTHHSAIVNAVQHSAQFDFMLGTASDDLTIQILDTRRDSTEKSALSVQGHSQAVNAIAFHPIQETILASGSSDGTIGIWDTRNFKQKVHSIDAHKSSVMSLEWNPMDSAVLGSGSSDRRICFWDLSKAGEEQTPEDAEDGPPELLFMHGGHTNTISDFSFNQNDPWVVCSAAEDNLIQVWRVANAIVGKEREDDVPREELE